MLKEKSFDGVADHLEKPASSVNRRTMLACTARWKCLNDDSLNSEDEDDSSTQRSPASTEAIRNLTAQDMALKLSRAHRPCTVSKLSHEVQLQRCIESEAGSESGKPNAGSSSSTEAWSINSNSSKGHVLGDINANASKNSTPTLHTSPPAVETMMEEQESKERISQVEPGVLITLVSLKEGGNELKRVRFSREFFSERQAQCWWTENYNKVAMLYNVQAHAKDESVTVPAPPSSKDEEFSGPDKHVAQPIQNGSHLGRGLYATRTSSSRDADPSEDLQSRDKSSEQEWAEEDELGVCVIIRCSPTGSRKIKRVKFSREKFSDMQAKLWWEENRSRLHHKYIDCSLE